MFIRQSVERSPLWYVLPDKAVHVLVRATFPRVVWAGEIHVYSKFVGNLPVTGELLPVVGRNALPSTVRPAPAKPVPGVAGRGTKTKPRPSPPKG